MNEVIALRRQAKKQSGRSNVFRPEENTPMVHQRMMDQKREADKASSGKGPMLETIGAGPEHSPHSPDSTGSSCSSMRDSPAPSPGGVTRMVGTPGGVTRMVGTPGSNASGSSGSSSVAKRTLGSSAVTSARTLGSSARSLGGGKDKLKSPKGVSRGLHIPPQGKKG